MYSFGLKLSIFLYSLFECLKQSNNHSFEQSGLRNTLCLQKKQRRFKLRFMCRLSKMALSMHKLEPYRALLLTTLRGALITKRCPCNLQRVLDMDIFQLIVFKYVFALNRRGGSNEYPQLIF